MANSAASATRPAKCRSKAIVLTCMRFIRTIPLRPWSSPRIWTLSLRSSHLLKTRIAFMGAARATRKGSSPRKSRQRNTCNATDIYVGLLFLVGEERDSLGAKVANDHAPAELPIPREWRAYGKSHRSRVKRNIASRGHGQGTHGALCLSRARRFRDRQADCVAGEATRHASAVRSASWPMHTEHRADRRRTRAQRDSRLRPCRSSLPPRWIVE